MGDWVGRTGGRAAAAAAPLAGSIPQVSMVSAESIISHTMACNYKGQLCATAAGAAGHAETRTTPITIFYFEVI